MTWEQAVVIASFKHWVIGSHAGHVHLHGILDNLPTRMPTTRDEIRVTLSRDGRVVHDEIYHVQADVIDDDIAGLVRFFSVLRRCLDYKG